MTRSGQFSFTHMHQTGRKLSFGFSCSRFGAFEETVTLSSEGAVPGALLALLHVALGVSTYKTAAAGTVVFPALPAAGRAMAEALYTDGLAEFFVRAGLPFPPQTRFEGDILPAAAAPGPSSAGSHAPIVAFGGGKDSYVAGAIVEKATGLKPQYASVVMADKVAEVLTRTAPSPLLFVYRSLDPKLLALKDGFTGHVPITAINMLVLTIEGFLRGAPHILFANERSADEPTMMTETGPANHQYSKSSTFEEILRRAVAESAPEAPPVYSVLRPFSELWIGAQFAALTSAFPRFTSCNRNFRLAGDADKRWCGACAKCAFTSLILAPCLSDQDVRTIFGRNMLDLEALQPFYEELLGLADKKPWDCVGTIAECQAALHLARDKAPFADSLAVRTWYPELRRTKSEMELIQQGLDAMLPEARGALPREYHDAALEL
jgi:hypothetical protein